MFDEEAQEHTAHIIARLQAQGRAEEAWRLHRAVTDKIGDALLFALRETCDTILTMVEALDPTTETLLEELRAKIDIWLAPGHPPT